MSGVDTHAAWVDFAAGDRVRYRDVIDGGHDGGQQWRVGTVQEMEGGRPKLGLDHGCDGTYLWNEVEVGPPEQPSAVAPPLSVHVRDAVCALELLHA
eukprot:gene46942-26618_t